MFGDDGATRDVSSCERLILIIRFVYFQHERGELKSKLDTIRWQDIDRLKAECKVLPNEYSQMLAVIEQYRP